MKPVVALVLASLMSACAGGMAMLPGEDNQKVEVEGDVFYVRLREGEVLVRNFATGLHNQNRLFTNAQTAIGLVTDCPFTNFRQLPDINAYEAALNCPAPPQNG